MSLSPYQILRKPVITEKAAIVGSYNNSVVFEVNPKATKTEIKRAVEKIFDVKVRSVRTLNRLGKLRRSGKNVGMTRSTKKAYVNLAPGSTIDLIEGL